MIPTGQQIAETARLVYLGETEVPGGQMFTDAILNEPINTAYRVLIDNLMRTDDRHPRRMAYYNLPAYTTSITPEDMGIANMGGPKELWHRSVGVTWEATIEAFNAATKTAPSSVDLTLTGGVGDLSTGDQVVAFNFDSAVTQDINDMWRVEVVDGNTIRLLGCSAADATGAGVGTIGVISNSPEAFPAQPNSDLLLEIQDDPGDARSILSSWCFKDGRFRFPPCSTARQIKVLYLISGKPPDNLAQSFGVDNSLNFLASYAAGLAANARGTTGTAERIFTLAVGNPSGDPGDGDGGFLGQYLRPQVKIQQNVRVVMPPFRQKRNTGFGGLGW